MIADIIETYAIAFTADDSLFKNLDYEKEFEGTDQRARKFLQESFAFGEIPTEKAVSEILLKSAIPVTEKHCTCDVEVSPIKVLGLCPHHFAPVRYTVTVKYQPHSYVVGVSKIPRFVHYLFRFPVVQERLTELTSELFAKIVRPRWVEVEVVGKHACVGYRGAKEHASVRTSRRCNGLLTP